MSQELFLLQWLQELWCAPVQISALDFIKTRTASAWCECRKQLEKKKRELGYVHS